MASEELLPSILNTPEAQALLKNATLSPAAAKLIVHLAQKIEEMNTLEIDFYQIPGGVLPQMMTDEAIGYDAYARAIVDPRHKFEEEQQYIRETLVDFENTPKDVQYRQRMVNDPDDRDRYGIVVPMGGLELVGLGFCTAMNYPGFYWMAPRSGLSSRGISVENSPGTVDSDYRGEAGALLKNKGVYSQLRNQGFEYEQEVSKYFTPEGGFILTKNLRIVQIIPQIGINLVSRVVENHSELGDTNRGAGGFGSTGLTG